MATNNNAISDRIIALVDMDCFYVQVEQRRNPEFRGKPCVVVQYKKWKGGGIIAVGYEARAFGVTRQMRGDDAKAKCPDVNLIYVPENRGKADLTHYRQAGAEVIKVLSEFSNCLERASIDEAFIDLSEAIEKYKSKYTIDEVAIILLKSTHVVGLSSPFDSVQTEESVRETEAYGNLMRKLLTESNLNLALGGIIANEMRAAVLEKTQFTCSAGIAHNKMLAKLIAGLHKPKQQTLVFQEDVDVLFKEVKIKKVRHLGGKLGVELQQAFKIEMMSELANISMAKTRQHFGEKNGDWIYWLGQGVDYEPIRPRQLPQSVGCCKNFRGREKLASLADVSYWLSQLASEVCERLEQEIEMNNRIPTHLCVSLSNSSGASVSRSCGVSRIDAEQVKTDALRVINVFNSSSDPAKWDPPIILLGLSSSKFIEYTNSSTKSIRSFFTESSAESNIFSGSPFAKYTERSKKPNVDREIGKTEFKCKANTGLKKFFGSVPTKKSCDMAVEKSCSLQSNEKPKTVVPDFNEMSLAKHDDTSEVNKPLLENSFEKAGCSLLSGNDVITVDDFVICKKCGKRILAWELPEHNDFHFAQELQYGINKQDKNETKSWTLPPKKKLKRSSNSIKSFFK